MTCIEGHKITLATPEMAPPTSQKKRRMSPQCRQFVTLINKLRRILSKDPDSEEVLIRMKLSIGTLRGQDETISIEPEVYRGAENVADFFMVMAKYWNCYDDHDLLEMVIESTENKEAISVLSNFLQNKDREVIMPTEKCPEAPFQSPCQGNSSDSRPKDLAASASSEIPACKIADCEKSKENECQVQIPSEQPTSSQSSSTQRECADTNLVSQSDISQRNNKKVVTTMDEPVTQQPKLSSGQDPESNECLHYHPGDGNKTPSKQSLSYC